MDILIRTGGGADVLDLVGKWATIVAAVVGMVGVGTATITYLRSVRLKRAEWLQKLYQQFYEAERYRTVREILDYRPERQISEIHAHLRDQSKGELIEKLWDYLNFFEFVAGLVKLKQIKDEDLKLLFDYPLRRVARDAQIMAKLDGESYEYLNVLLRARFASPRA